MAKRKCTEDNVPETVTSSIDKKTRHQVEAFMWIKDRLTCPVCDVLVFGAMSNGQCGHVVCHACSRVIQTTSNKCPLCQSQGVYTRNLVAEAIADQIETPYIAKIRKAAKITPHQNAQILMCRCTSADVAMFMEWYTAITRINSADLDIRQITRCLKPDDRRRLVINDHSEVHRSDTGVIVNGHAIEFGSSKRACVMYLSVNNKHKFMFIAVCDATPEDALITDEFSSDAVRVEIKDSYQ